MAVLAAMLLVGQAAHGQSDPANPAPLPASQASDPKPAGNPGDWITGSDWPSDDLLKGANGLVGFQLTVSAEGKPMACTTFQTSNRSELDYLTCALMMKRAQFVPAHDAAGRAVEGTYRNLVRWSDHAKTSPAPKPGHLTIAYDITTSGKVADCQVTVDGSLLAIVPIHPQAICANTGPFDPQFDAAGKPVVRHVVITNEVRVDSVVPAKP